MGAGSLLSHSPGRIGKCGNLLACRLWYRDGSCLQGCQSSRFSPELKSLQERAASVVEMLIHIPSCPSRMIPSFDTTWFFSSPEQRGMCSVRSPSEFERKVLVAKKKKPKPGRQSPMHKPRLHSALLLLHPPCSGVVLASCPAKYIQLQVRLCSPEHRRSHAVPARWLFK